MTKRFDNNNNLTSGRFGNHFFRNMIAHLISENNDIKFNYSYKSELLALGFELYEGKTTYTGKIFLTDDNCMSYINDHNIKRNINLCYAYFQTSEIAKYLRNYCNTSDVKSKIVLHNPYNLRYNNNNDVFVHVRIGDVPQFTPDYKYFDSVLGKLNFNKGYISSDTPDHEICTKLIEKYKMSKYEETEVNTIQFGSSCRYIVISGGTFSWIIGVLGYNSVILPRSEYEGKMVWGYK